MKIEIEARVIESKNEEERIAQLGTAFRSFLEQWFTMLVMGVRFTPGVARELGLSLCEYAATALIATSEAAEKEPDEQTAERAKRAGLAALEIINREVLS